MTTSRLLCFFALPALLWLTGCPQSPDASDSPRAPDRGEAIRRQYIDREQAVEQSMEGRMAYQVKPPDAVLEIKADSPAANLKTFITTLLENAEDNPLEAAYALEALRAKPQAAEVDLDAAQTALSQQLELARQRLDARAGEDVVDLDLYHDLAVLTVLSAVLDQEQYALDYERGVVGLLDALETAGRFGELRGGALRSLNINHALTQAAYIAALKGDDRLRSHPYFAFAPYWLMHRFQPGGEPYVTHEATPQQARAIAPMTASQLASLASLYPSPEIKWWFENFSGEETGAGFELANRYLEETELPDDFEPPPYGLYPHAGVLFWRSNWTPTADALLARGAVDNDPNARFDAGHIAWTAHGEPVLIKAEAAAKALPIRFKEQDANEGQENRADESEPEFRDIPAFNVLRVGEAQPVPGRAPIVTRELNASGGNLRIDASELYPELSLWHRDLFWETGGEMRIIDTIRYDFGQRERTTAFWHLNATEPVKVQQDRSRSIIEWGDSAIVIQGNSPIEIEQFLVPDSPSATTSHIVLALRTIGRPPSLRILTRVLPREAPAETEEAAKMDKGEDGPPAE